MAFRRSCAFLDGFDGHDVGELALEEVTGATGTGQVKSEAAGPSIAHSTDTGSDGRTYIICSECGAKLDPRE